MSIDTPYPMASEQARGTGSQNTSALVLCGARTRQGGECRHVAMTNGKCRFHGGLSTGRKTAAGIESHRAAVTIHGGRSQEMVEFRRRIRELRVAAQRTIEMA